MTKDVGQLQQVGFSSGGLNTLLLTNPPPSLHKYVSGVHTNYYIFSVNQNERFSQRDTRIISIFSTNGTGLNCSVKGTARGWLEGANVKCTDGEDITNTLTNYYHIGQNGRVGKD
nr:hypothetical protein HmN_000680800 [Hymenolepis microstoma]